MGPDNCSPAIGAMLALAAALAAACFVRVYGIAFLGRPRTEPRPRQARRTACHSGAMGGLAGIVHAGGRVPGIVIAASRRS